LSRVEHADPVGHDEVPIEVDHRRWRCRTVEPDAHAEQLTGETIQSLSVGYAPPASLAPGHLVPAPELPFVIIAPEFFREDLAQDLNPKLAAELAAAQHPTSAAILGAASGPGAWHALPSWYAVSAADRVIDPDLQRFMAQRARSTTVQYDDASHAGGFTHYAARFVKLIEQTVQATAS
jgi:pimeloyl-ACP methyl ester carboxylesterase